MVYLQRLVPRYYTALQSGSCLIKGHSPVLAANGIAAVPGSVAASANRIESSKRAVFMASNAHMNSRSGFTGPDVGLVEDSPYEHTILHTESIENPMKFWEREAEKVHWYKKYRTVLDISDFPFYKWFAGGKVNICYDCVDKHVIEGHGGDIAVYYDSPVTSTKAKMTFSELQNQVSKCAGALAELGVKYGDRVLIYMPVMLETMIAMLACARIGAPHSVVFGGFGRHELAVRINHAEPKVIIAASCGIDKGKPIDYKKLLTEGLLVSDHKPDSCIIVQRKELKVPLVEGFDLDWNDLISKAPEHPIVPVDSNHPLYIIYTSGTTGTPKGIIRDHAGNLVSSAMVFDLMYGCRKGQTMFAAVDLAWVLGHACLVYGPLIFGAKALLYEGKPVGTPDAGALWRLVEEYKIHTFLGAPTALRIIRKEDPDGILLNKYDLTSLHNLMFAGERLDVTTSKWLEGHVNASRKALGCDKYIPVVDNWWQSETGYPVTHILNGVKSGIPIPAKAGSCNQATPGWDLQVLDEDGNQCPPNVTGNMVLKLPLPPGASVTLWRNPEKYKATYLERFPGYYSTGDIGSISDDGYCYISGRSDDVINVSAYRFSTAAFEEVLTQHTSVSESVVVGIEDEMKGQVPIGIVVLAEGSSDAKIVEEELAHNIREELGAIASFRRCLFVPRLPKTKSGKTLRRTIAQIADGKPLSIPPTIEDITVLDEIKECFRVQMNLPKLPAASKL